MEKVYRHKMHKKSYLSVQKGVSLTGAGPAKLICAHSPCTLIADEIISGVLIGQGIVQQVTLLAGLCCRGAPFRTPWPMMIPIVPE